LEAGNAYSHRDRGHHHRCALRHARPTPAASAVNRTANRLTVAAPLLAVLALLGAGSGSALAASTNPASDQYGGGADVLGETAGGSLPFTGINLIVLLGLGLCMIAAGLTVRRVSGRNASNSYR
jgi:hypothetical protein